MKMKGVWVWVLIVSCLCTGGLAAQQTDSNSATSAHNLPAASQPVPRLIMFSGTVKDLTGKPLTGPVDLNFAIYKEQTDAAPLWQESQTLNVDEQGRYTVLLGAMQQEGLPTELFTTGEARWLGVSAGTLPEQPRTLLVSVPYALKAGDAETLGGKPASAFMLAQQTSGSGTTLPSGVAVTPDTAKLGGGPTPYLVGTGVQNYIPLWTDSAGTLGNSVMFQSGGLVGVGTTTPGVALDVYGTNAGLRLFGAGTHQLSVTGATSGRLGQDAAGFFFSSDTNGAALRFGTNNGSGHEWMRITSAGNVGVGTTTPAQRLDVSGNLKITGAGNAIIFPDGTVQSTAGTGSGGGTITAVTAGTGLAGGGTGGNVTLSLANSSCTAGSALTGLPLTCQPFATLGANTFTGPQTISSGNLSVGAGNVVASGSITSTTGLISGARGSYSGTSADQIVSVLQSGTGSGLIGTTLGISATSAGVSGSASSTSSSSYAAGVSGYASGFYGNGVYGAATSSHGVGVKGENLSSVWGTGVLGVSAANDSQAIGVQGQATSTGNGIGVFGTSAGTYGIGVSGSASNNIGVLGGGNVGVEGWGYQTGVYGYQLQAGIGVYGRSDHGTAIKAEVPSSGSYQSTAVLATTATSQDGTTGVYGWTSNLSGASIGVHGRSDSSTGIGVLGEATSTAFGTFGVRGTTASSLGTALAGVATGGGIGAYGESDTNVAGDFNRTDGSTSGSILQARSGSDIKFKVQGDGSVYANHFFGDGSGLTNLPGGAATDLNCTACVSPAEVSFSYAGSSSQGGAATSALTASTATTATNALALGGLASSAYEQVANKNVASGYAGLDSSSRLAKAQAPSATAYKDASNAFTTGTQDLSAATATLPVKSVLSASTPSSCTANKELLIKTDATAGQQLFICNGSGNGWNLVGDGSGGAGVTSFNSRTGAVSPATNDYAFNQISGTVGSTQLSGTYSNALTFSSASNSFTGSGAGLTGLSASSLGSGTLPDARLSGTYTGALTLSNASNSFTGNGAGLTALTAANISSGTAGINISGNALTATTATNATQLGGVAASGYPQLATANTYTSGKQTFVASTASAATLNVPSGVAPTTPATGDFWNLSGILKFYDGSHTNSLTTIQSAPTSGHLAVWSGTAGLLADGGAAATGTVTSVGLVGTANQITVTGASPITTSGSWTLSFPSAGVTLPGTTTGTFSGNVTGNVSGSSGSTTGNAATATALAATPAQCGSNNWATGIAAGGAANCSQPGYSNLSGTLPSAALSGTYSGALTLSNASNSFTGSGAGLTGVTASGLAAGTYSNALTFSSASNSFTGSGAGLTSLNASNLSSGTVASARINGTYSNALTFSNASNSFTGNGAGLTNVNADTLDGLHATSFGTLGANTFVGSQSITGDLALSGSINGATASFSAGAGVPIVEVTQTSVGNPAVLATAPNYAGVIGRVTGGSTLNSGVRGEATATSGATIGVLGVSSSSTGVGVYGDGGDSGVKGHVPSTSNGSGVYGVTEGTSGQGVYGRAMASSGGTFGVSGFADSTEGTGVYGEAYSTSGNTVGVEGMVGSPNGVAGLFWAWNGGKILSGLGDGGAERFSVDWVGNVHTFGNITTTGTVAAASLSGDGSGLTNITAGTANNLTCTGCVGNTQLGVNYAASASKGGDAGNALLLNGLASSAFQPAGSYATLAANSFSGQNVFASLPASASVGAGPVYINPASATTNYTLLGLAVGGTQKFRVNADGDVSGRSALFSGAVATALEGQGSSSGTTFGVKGNTTSTGGTGVRGDVTATTGQTIGLHGVNSSEDGIAVLGFNNSTATAPGPFGIGPTGVKGSTQSSVGLGVFGQSTATTGATIGVKGEVRSDSGVAGLFDKYMTTSGDILLARSGTVSLSTVFHVDGSGNVYANAYKDLAGNPIGGGGVTSFNSRTGAVSPATTTTPSIRSAGRSALRS